MATERTLADLITRDPKLRGGRPILAGTGVTVRTIVGWYKLGKNAEEIAADMDLDLALVYAALTYYHLHREEIETDIEADSEEKLMKQDGVLEQHQIHSSTDKMKRRLAPVKPTRFSLI